MIETILRFLRIDPYEPTLDLPSTDPEDHDASLKEAIIRGKRVKDIADRHSDEVERRVRSWDEAFIGGDRRA